MIAVLEDMNTKVSWLNAVPVRHDQALLDGLDELGDGELRRCLQQQWELEEKLEMVQAGDAVRGKQTPEELKAELSACTRSVCRGLRKNEKAVELLLSLKKPEEDDEATEEFERLTRELTKITFKKLTTTVEDEEANATLLSELEEKEQRLAEEAAVLQQTLESERAERDRENMGREAAVEKLSNELEALQRANETKMADIKSDMEQSIKKAEETHKANSEKLLEEIRTMTIDLDDESAKHRDQEAALRKKKERVEAEINALKTKYDEDMGDMRAKIKDLRDKMAVEKEELRVLEEHFAKVDANEARKQDEEARLNAFRNRVKAAEKVLDDAAANIQKVVRGKQLRAFVRQLMNKKKKGRKGGATKGGGRGLGGGGATTKKKITGPTSNKNKKK